MLLPKESLFLLFLLLPTSCIVVVQAQQALCDQCGDAGACFGSGPCAACGASEDCTGVCKSCASAGPCRSCFEEEKEAVLVPVSPSWPVQVPELGCDYAMDKEEVTVVRGEIPTWLSGTFYHAQHTNSSHEDYKGNVANPTGILAITFFGGGDDDDDNESGNNSSAGMPMASFAYAKGNQWQEKCQGSSVQPIMLDCVVSVNQFGTPGTIASVCAAGDLVQFATDDSGGVDFNGILEFTWQTSNLKNNNTNSTTNIQDTYPYGPDCAVAGYCPKNLQPEHMPIDSNGDVYGLYYNMQPAGYRIFKVPKGTMERVELAFVESEKDVPSYTHMGPIPTANYIVLVEAPMPLNLEFDWEVFQKSFDPTTPVTIYVMEKKENGNVLAQYTTESAFWTWHVANAWEDCETGEIHLDVTHDPNAHSFKSFYNSTPGDFEKSSLARITLSNPQTAGQKALAVTTTILDTAGLGIEFPVTQDQYQFAGKTGHYWMAGSRENSDLAFPLSMVAVVKHDVEAGKATHTWEPDSLHMGEPFHVPREKDQGAMSDDGVILVVAMNSTGYLFGAILDASDLEELALFEIPMAQVPTFGLHSYHSTVSTWVSTAESCGVEDGAPPLEADPDLSSSAVAAWSASAASIITVLLTLSLL